MSNNDFNFDDDNAFEINTGVPVDGLDTEESWGDTDSDDTFSFNSEQNTQLNGRGQISESDDFSFSDNQPVQEKSGHKKIALIAIIFGVAIILVCLLLFNISNHFRNKVDTPQTNNVAQNQTSEDIKGNEDNLSNQEDYTNQPVNQPVQNQDNNQNIVEQNNNQVPNENMNASSEQNMPTSDDWVQFELAGDIDFSESTNSEFTVTNIQHFAKLVNSENDKIVKSIVTGNISGLVGTYEVEIPYYKAIRLQPGTLLKIQYHYSIQNGVRIIGEIIFV